MLLPYRPSVGKGNLCRATCESAGDDSLTLELDGLLRAEGEECQLRQAGGKSQLGKVQGWQAMRLRGGTVVRLPPCCWKACTRILDHAMQSTMHCCIIWFMKFPARQHSEDRLHFPERSEYTCQGALVSVFLQSKQQDIAPVSSWMACMVTAGLLEDSMARAASLCSCCIIRLRFMAV